MNVPEARISRSNTIIWLFFVFFACLYFSYSYNAKRDFLDLAEYTRGLSLTPYQYRALPMFLFRALVDRPVVVHIAARMPPQLRSPYQIVQLGLSLFSLIGCVLATYGTLNRLTGFDRRFTRWASLLVLYMAYFMLAPGWGLDYTLPYDTPSLFFFCLGIYLIVCREIWKKWAYYVIFPLAVLNRETACFLTVFYLIWEWQQAKENDALKTARVRLLLHVAAQAIIWIVVKKALAHAFAANAPDGVMNGHYLVVKSLYNVKEILSPKQWPILLSINGFLLPVIFAGRKWIQNPGIARGCAIILPLWILGMMLVGVIIEIRVFSETASLAALALSLILYNRFYLPANDALKAQDLG